MNDAVYLSPGTWQLSDEKERLYRKELIHVGDFVASNLRFSVTEAMLRHWQSTFAQFSSNGIEVPMPVEHTVDPEKRRGTIVGMDVAVNKRGQLALYGTAKFRDPEAEKLAASANVSIYVPAHFKDGEGREYEQPITHVALTDYPVIPGLEKFEALAASHVIVLKLSQGDFTLDITKLNAAIEAVTAAATAATEGQKTLTALAKNPMDEQTQQAARDAAAACKEATAAASGALDAMLGTGEPAKPEPPKKDPEPPKPGEPEPPKIAASMINMLRDNRGMKIDNLVREFRITKAVADDLKKTHCSDQALSLSLSGSADSFDSLVSALAKNEPVLSSREKTGSQAVRLSHVVDPSTNPVIRDAEERARRAAGK